MQSRRRPTPAERRRSCVSKRSLDRRSLPRHSCGLLLYALYERKPTNPRAPAKTRLLCGNRNVYSLSVWVPGLPIATDQPISALFTHSPRSHQVWVLRLFSSPLLSPGVLRLFSAGDAVATERGHFNGDTFSRSIYKYILISPSQQLVYSVFVLLVPNSDPSEHLLARLVLACRFLSSLFSFLRAHY